MNVLAHFLLAHPTSASRCGNFLGDFVKGRPDSLEGQYSPDIIAGIVMHRAIDRFTDTHPAFLKGKALLSAPHKRFAGIVLDLFTDHFLAKHWPAFHPQSLHDFTREIARDLQQHASEMPPRALLVSQQMLQQRWFEKYQTIDGLSHTLVMVSRRRDRFAPIAACSEDLQSHYQEYKELSFTLLQEALLFAKNL